MAERIRGSLSILVGIDGSGKTTLVNGLEQNGYKTTHWKKLKQICPELNVKNPAEELQLLDGEERLLFISNYIQSEWNKLIQPLRDDGINVISDSFFAKFYAKEKVYKRLNLDDLKKQCPLNGKEVFIMLDTPTEVAFDRKKIDTITPYECLNGPDDFVSFQSRQRKELLEFVKDYKFYLLNGEKSKEELLNETLNILKDNRILAK